MEIEEPSTSDYKNVLLAKGTHISPNKVDISADSFFVLKIAELENVKSNLKDIHNSFAIIPVASARNTNNFLGNSVFGYNSFIKYFNPPLPSLDRISIQFRDVYGNLINFNGIEHFMEFRITCLNNPGHYVAGSFQA